MGVAQWPLSKTYAPIPATATATIIRNVSILMFFILNTSAPGFLFSRCFGYKPKASQL